jgi:hypothetical protein
MSKSVISDLSSEMPSGRLPPGRHHFEARFWIPLVGWRLRLSAKSPDRAPAAIATTALALATAGLAIPLILALVVSYVRLPSWTILVSASVYAAAMMGETRWALWYQRGRAREQNLAETEGAPTDASHLLIEHLSANEQQTLELEAEKGQVVLGTINWASPARSLAALGMAFLILAVASLIPAAAFTSLAAAVSASAPVTAAAAVLGSVAAAACGTVMMIRVEQLERDILCLGDRPDSKQD